MSLQITITPTSKSAVTAAKPKPPRMEVPGVKITVLEGMRSRLQQAVKKMDYTIYGNGYDGDSTRWAVAVYLSEPAKFDIYKFEDELRDLMNFSGWLQVGFFDLVEKDEDEDL